MMLLPRIMVFILLLIGLYLISSLFRVRANRRALAHKPDKPVDKLLYPAVRLVAPLINLTNYKRRKLLTDLERAEIKQTPEEYYAAAIVKAFGMGILSALFFFLGMAIPAICFLVATVLVYMREITVIDDRLKKKDEAIREALPHFVSVITDMYKTDRNIAKIFESYLADVPDTPLRVDLAKVIGIMNTNGNIADALWALDKAIGQQQLSVFLTALIEAHKGTDQTISFKICIEQMRVMQLETIRSKTAQRPQKMQTVSYVVAAVIITLFLVPLVLQLLSINTLF